MTTPEAADEGQDHLAWIVRFQAVLVALGAGLWLFRSWRAALVHLLAGGLSVTFWLMHRWTVTGMLTPSVRRRWLFALLALFKLGLIALGLRGIMSCFPGEVHPLSTGILVFVGGILLEAIRLAVCPGSRTRE